MDINQTCKQCGKEICYGEICVSCRFEKERDRILALTETEINDAVNQICNEIKSGQELQDSGDLFTHLVNYRDIDTTLIAETAFQSKLFRPYEMYKNAPDYVIRGMLEILMSDNTESSVAGNLLLCLAAHGGRDVLNAFWELERHPRKWRENLYVSPSFYAAYGGWSYDGSGRMIKINFDQCYPMVKGTQAEKEKSPVKIGVKTEETCPHCGCRIVNLLEIDGRDPRLDFLEIKGVIKAKCCPNCLAFSSGEFCRYSVDGESRIISGEDRCDKDYLKDEGVNELAGNTYVLGDTPVPPRYTCDWEGGSAIGGFAFWIQDCDIKLCPDCGKPMKYLAQIQWDTVIDCAEGNAYFEICRDCGIIAVLHQQT